MTGVPSSGQKNSNPPPPKAPPVPPLPPPPPAAAQSSGVTGREAIVGFAKTWRSRGGIPDAYTAQYAIALAILDLADAIRERGAI